MSHKARDFSHHISKESALRRPSPLKCAYAYTLREGMITMGGGLPEPCYFPFSALEAVVPELGRFSEKETQVAGDRIVIQKYRTKENNVLSLSDSLQYAQGYGVSDFLKFVTEHTKLAHKPPYEDWQCSITAGNTQGLALCLRMLCSRGDALLLEEFAYPAAVETADPMGLKLCGIAMDSEGIRDDILEEKLDKWDEQIEGAKRPTVIYLVPCGQNPSGATLGINRRKRIYKICQKYDIVIIEDDPYCTLNIVNIILTC
ncbi:Aromatic amino acid aminotransferase [Neolecta irregularis DAH-3]|uniref:Aromatic amino acid aminotransferase n=1 Tax=Neolecta irregularis (strain DAH-3) TaxID=1198029 RepID=A0A1U7LJD1_NEOID|nr:Aromatic amino acid aminotransferase [Neolecta irregularis DAH-3]|eukprot:OLL22738.1 Aromatic amino acid aminotransferase [Neolecta irregularis DAH-3]